jgi:hypothetical protein
MWEEAMQQIRELKAENERLRQQVREYELREYGWQCSACKQFQKIYPSDGHCYHCGRKYFLTGSFKREDLEEWFDRRQALAASV